jgi:hypothetical protein
VSADPLGALAHRPWPLPAGPWVMAQSWHDLLFAHWPLAPEDVRPLVPGALALDLWDRRAGIGVVPFRMSGVRLRGLPPLPGSGAFPELNLRTYVRLGDRPRVWFFSLDAASPLAVAVVRAWFHLPYHRARMRCQPRGEDVEYASERTHRGAARAALLASYGPAGPEQRAAPGTLEHWLTERYCLYARAPGGGLWRGEIHHASWPLQPARARVERCTLLEAQGLRLPGAAPHLLFARRIDVRLWAPRRVG